MLENEDAAQYKVNKTGVSKLFLVIPRFVKYTENTL